MINYIHIDKFRQLKDITIKKFGLVNELYGSNGSGKTSFISFITWMLYGETLDYGKDDDLNIDTFNQEDLLGGAIECNDYVFERKYGYTSTGKKINEFYVNNRKCKNQNEYYSAINQAFNLNIPDIKIKDFNLIRAFSDPYYLPQNETQFRVLIESLLNVDTYSILFENEKYKNIKNDFDKQQKSYDLTRDFYKQQLKTIDSDIDNTDTRIAEIKALKFDEKEYDDIANQLQELRKNYNFTENKELQENIDLLNEKYEKLIESRKQDLVEKLKSENELKLEQKKLEFNNLLAEYNEKVQTNSYNANLRNLVSQKINELSNQLKELQKTKFEEIRCPECNCLVNDNDYKVFNKNKVEKTKKLKEKIEISKKELASYKDFVVTEMQQTLTNLKAEINDLKAVVTTNPNIYSSERSKALENEYNKQHEIVIALREQEKNRKDEYIKEYQNKIQELESKYNALNSSYLKHKDLEIYRENKKILLANKSTYELRLSLLEEYRNAEINLINSKTTEIFGDKFEFEMLVKNKSNDSYKKVCRASIGGLEHNKSNTAKYLKYSIMLLENLKNYIGGCDMPIIFDIADNIGKSARNDIFDLIKTSQIFYTRIADDDKVERTLNIVKE